MIPVGTFRLQISQRLAEDSVEILIGDDKASWYGCVNVDALLFRQGGRNFRDTVKEEIGQMLLEWMETHPINNKKEETPW